MAKPTKLTAEQQEIVRAQNDARLRLPADLNERIKIIADHRLLLARQKDAVAEAKEEHDAAGSLKVLTSRYGLLPQSIKTINLLAGMEPPKRSAALRQIIGHGEDEGWIIPDLFDKDAFGVGSNDEAGDGGAVFDSTSEGQRRGGTNAEPRTVEEMAATHQPAPTEAIPLEVAVQQLEEYRAANPPKRGAKSKELKRLEQQVQDAQAAGDEQAPIAALPEAEPGEITEGLREANAEADAHLRVMSSGPAASPAEEPAEAAVEKPKRQRKKAAPKAAAAPPPPPPADDDEDDSFPVEASPSRPGVIGDQPSSFQVG